MKLSYLPRLSLLCFLAGCASPTSSSPGTSADKPDDYGILLMAHGGNSEWNEGVLSAVKPLEDKYTIEVAFGMADAVSIQEAAERLEAQGKNKIGVVRLFVSGESWRERTEQILGLRQGAPARPVQKKPMDMAGHGGHSMEFWRLQTGASYSVSTQGLAEAKEMGDILADRAQKLSNKPAEEDVLILAHGPADDSENERWITYIEARTTELQRTLPFRRVQVMTLREDWPEKRKQAVDRIRAFVDRAQKEGGTAIVIPFRVQGFGPYTKVLEGLDYVSDGQGLIPHPRVTQWIETQIQQLRQGPFRSVRD